jgi:hypothetical protein
MTMHYILFTGFLLKTKHLTVCFKNLDDEPSDGPNQYVFLSGFYSTGILNSLDTVGARIDTVTNVSCDSLDDTKRLFNEMMQRDRQEQTLKADVLKDIRTYEIIRFLNEIILSNIDHFQQKIQYVRNFLSVSFFVHFNLITNYFTYQMRFP